MTMTTAAAPVQGAERATPLLEVRDLTIEVRTPAGFRPVVSNVNLTMSTGETVGLVGESGSGKSMTAQAILGLVSSPTVRIARGSIRYNGRELVGNPAEYRRVRGREIGMIFQEPMTSLNPAYTVGDQISETIRTHTRCSAREAWTRTVAELERVGIADAARRADDYPHSFSGGMRQRAMIAMALSCRPKILLADEPTTALDVTVEGRILELLKELQAELQLSILLISHDLSVIREFCERTIVMYAGEHIEAGPTTTVLEQPMHPYTNALLECMPTRVPRGQRLPQIDGEVVVAGERPAGCAFGPRCGHFKAGVCDAAPIAIERLDAAHEYRCIRASQIFQTERKP